MINASMHTVWSDPGRHRWRVRGLAPGPTAAAAAARNVIGHFAADFEVLAPERRAEVNARRLERILDYDQGRHSDPLDQPREAQSRVAGCCRDHALFFVGVLREQGIPARTRLGFADYLIKDRRVDHVVAEHHDGDRWIRIDPEFAPGARPFDVTDLDHGPDAPFQTAAEAWQRCRADSGSCVDYQIPPGSGFVDVMDLLRSYVLLDLAHRVGVELLLWDDWPSIRRTDLETVDRIAELLGQPDDQAQQAALSAVYAQHGPGGSVTQLSPFDDPPRIVELSGG